MKIEDLKPFTDRHGLEFISVKKSIISLIFEFKINSSFKLRKFEADLPDFSLISGFPIRLILPYAPGKLALEIALQSSTFFTDCLNAMKDEPSPLAIPLGVSGGRFETLRLDQSLHLMVAGSTGSGKSTFLRAAVEALRRRNTPETLRLGIIDPKGIDFPIYNGDAFLYNPCKPYEVINSPEEASQFLGVLKREMQSRFEQMKKAKVRSIEQLKMPYLVVLIDEFAELLSDKDHRESLESTIVSLAQLGRGAGIYLILATQKPLTAVVSSMIKANFPSRISFRLPARSDYMSILDETPDSCVSEPCGSAWLKSPAVPRLMHFQVPLPIADKDITLKPAPKMEAILPVQEKRGKPEVADEGGWKIDWEKVGKFFTDDFDVLARKWEQEHGYEPGSYLK